MLEKVAGFKTRVAEKEMVLENYTHPTISMSAIKAEQKRTNEIDRLKRNFEKVMAIESYGFKGTYEKFHYNHRSDNELE